MLKTVIRYYKRDFDHMEPVKFYTKASTRHITRNHFFPQYTQFSAHAQTHANMEMRNKGMLKK